MSLIYVIVMFILCMILYKPTFKFFIIWMMMCLCIGTFLTGPVLGGIIWGFIVYCVIAGESGDDYSGSLKNEYHSDSSINSSTYYDRRYDNGITRTENLSKTGYYYSDGSESRKGMLGEEYRENGEVVYENPLTGDRDIYVDNICVGHERDDGFGNTYRY